MSEDGSCDLMMGARVNGVKNNLSYVTVLSRVSLPLVRNKLQDYHLPSVNRGLPRWHWGKNLPASAGDVRDEGLVPGLGRSPGGGHGSPLQASCLENPMDRGVWRATVHGVAESRTRLKRPSPRILTHASLIAGMHRQPGKHFHSTR